MTLLYKRPLSFSKERLFLEPIFVPTLILISCSAHNVPKIADIPKGLSELFLNQLFSTTCDYPLFWNFHLSPQVAGWICIGIQHRASEASDYTHLAAHF